MLNGPFTPREAEEKRDDFWTDIPEGTDVLPGALPGDEPDLVDALNRAGNWEPFNPPVDGEPQMDVMGPAHGDPLGSWTGVPADEDEIHTQDADDL